MAALSWLYNLVKLHIALLMALLTLFPQLTGKSDALQLRWDICYHIHAAPYVYGNDPDTNPMVWRQHFKGCFKHTKEAELRRIGQFSPCSRVALDTIASVYATGKTVVISQSGAGLRLDLEDPEPKAATSTVKN